MKKVLAILVAAVMLLTLAACGGETNNDAVGGSPSGEESTNGVDMSKYPSDLNDWSGQDFIDYFKEVGVFTDGNGFETWLQDHATYWPGTPVNECAGWWNDEGTIMVTIILLSADNADTSEEQLEEWKTSIKENHALPGEYASLPVDSLIGNVAFTFEETILDDAVYEEFTKAYEELLAAMNVTPEE